MILQKKIYVGMAAYLNQKKQRASLHVDMHARRSKCPNLRSNKQIENLLKELISGPGPASPEDGEDLEARSASECMDHRERNDSKSRLAIPNSSLQD